MLGQHFSDKSRCSDKGSFCRNTMLRQQILHCVFGVCIARGLFTYRDCNNSTNKLVHIENAKLSSDPIHIPGNETGEVDVHILQPINGSHYELHVRVQKHLFNGYVEMPCIKQRDGSEIGACTYELCDILGTDYSNPSSHCADEITQSTPNFPCNCPFAPGTYHLNPTTFLIRNPSGFWKFLAQGDYKAKVTITDTDTGEEVACYVASFTTEADCTGISCIIG